LTGEKVKTKLAFMTTQTITKEKKMKTQRNLAYELFTASYPEFMRHILQTQVYQESGAIDYPAVKTLYEAYSSIVWDHVSKITEEIRNADNINLNIED